VYPRTDCFPGGFENWSLLELMVSLKLLRTGGFDKVVVSRVASTTVPFDSRRFLLPFQQLALSTPASTPAGKSSGKLLGEMVVEWGASRRTRLQLT
jgi:hypothetical protein